MANNSQFTGMQPPIPPLAGPPQGSIPSMSLQQFQPMLPPQQAQPYVSGSSQHFQPLGHANVVMPPQPPQIQFPQPMQQVAGRPVVGGHNMSQGPPNPHDFQRNPPMSNNHMTGSGGPGFPLSSSYNQVNADSSSSQYQTQIHDHRFPSGVQPWMPTSNQNVNSATTMQNTGELAAPLVVPEANNGVDSVETTPSDWIEHTSRNGKKYYYNRRTRISSWEKPLELMTEMERADASTDWREFTSPAGRKYYYNKVTRKSNWKMPDEVKLAREKHTVSHASDFGSISSVKTSSPGADGSFVSAQGAMTSPIAVSPVANLPTIVASESSLSGKLSSPTVDAVEMQNSSEPASPAVANSEKIGITVTLGNSVVIPARSETTSAQDEVACDDGASPDNREEVKHVAAITGIGSAAPSEEKTVELGPLVYESKVEAKNAFRTLLESANIGSDCTWDQAMRAIINDRRYGALKSLGERKQAFNEYLSQRKKLEAEERRVKQKKAREDFSKSVYYSVFVALSTAFLTCPARVPQPKNCPSLEDMKKPPPAFPHTSVTSVKTFEAQDFLYIFKSFHGGPTVYDRVLSGLKGCSAILAKTCSQMEGPYIEYVKSQFKKPVFLVGPVVPDPPTGELEERWGNWLNKFELGSVIYSSFGSETFLTDDQIKELALGLEETGLPFFLVLNFPANIDVSTELNRVLPKGFMERVKERGIIHSGWVQQQQILAHSSVGCYVCHAGFSSVIEALVNDCQVVMLPQKGDQFLNAKLVSGDMKAGVEVNRRDEDGYFGKQDIKEAVEMVMMEEPGKLFRENQKKWKEFLLNKDIQCKFIEDLVYEMKDMAKISTN